jgi:PQQ-dependent dehydrogenase (s-GDH family)
MKRLFQIFLIALLNVITFFQLSAQEVWATDSINRTLTPSGSRYYLAHPFEILYGPDDSLYISEKVGRIRIVSSTTGLSRIILDHRASTFLNITRDGAGVATGIGQNGMMGIALDKNFKQGAGPHYIYVAYSYNATSLRISRFTYNLATGQLGSELQLLNGIPAGNDHSSGRLVYGNDDKLYYTCGDQGANQFASRCTPIRSQDLPTTAEVTAQTYTKYQGKILRMNLDGTIPSDNPLLDPDGAGAEVAVRSHVFTYGHRNAQGLVFEMNPNNGSSYPTLKTGGIIYSSEHGIRTDDEINLISAGNNYGWPYWAGFRNSPAENYRYINWSTASGGNCSSTGYNEVVIPTGATVTQENSFAAGSFTDPIFSMYPACNGAPNCNVTLTTGTNWMQYPTIAPSSIDHYGFTNIPGWHQSLLIPTLRRGTLYRYKLNATRNGIVNDSVPYFFRTDRYRDLALKNGTIIFTVTDSIGSTSGPSGGGTSSLTRPGTILKYTFLGYANNAGTSTIPTSIAIDGGTLNSCAPGTTVTINAANNNLWVPITGPNGDIVAEINANGNNLGNVTSSFFTRSGSPVRQIASGDKYANRNITINVQNQPAAGNPAAVRLYITAAELASIVATSGSGVTSITDLGIFKNSDPCGSSFAASLTEQQVVTGRHVQSSFGHALQANIQSFSSFYFFNTSSTLPVDFITISAAEQNNAAKIQWTVTNQGNISSYIVERSIDSRNFDAVGTVAAVNGNGDIKYSFTDYNAARFSSVVYYRVRAVEQSGQFKFTNIVNVAFGAVIKEMITLYPNPANDKTSLSIASNNDETAQVRIIDNTGRVVNQRFLNIVKGKNNFELNISNLSTGLYYIEVNGKTINQKIKLIKQ